LFLEVAPQQRRPVFGDGLMCESERLAGSIEHTELIREEKLAKSCAAGQLQFPSGTVAAPGDGKELLDGKGRAHRVEQRAEHRAGLESRGVERQRLQDIDCKESVIAEFGEHVGEQRGCLAHQGLVRWIVLRDVVAGWRRPVRTLDQKTEEGLL